MSNFNDRIKALLAFSASFERFKSDIEAKLDKLSKPVDLSGLVKRDDLSDLVKKDDLSGLVKEGDLNQSIDILSEELKKAKLDAFAFDSARRTFGEEIGVLKSFIDKEIVKLNDALSEQSKQMQELKQLLSAKDSSGRVESISSDRAESTLKSDIAAANK